MLIGYARVSTEDQKLRLQHDALTDGGCEKLLAFARKGDVVVVWKLDRLGRSLRDLIGVVNSLQDRGVGLRSLQEAIDTTTPAGKLTFHIFAALAEFERDMIRERTSAGLAAARKRGVAIGRPRALTPEQILMAEAMTADPAISTRPEVLVGVSVPEPSEVDVWRSALDQAVKDIDLLEREEARLLADRNGLSGPADHSSERHGTRRRKAISPQSEGRQGEHVRAAAPRHAADARMDRRGSGGRC